MKRNAFTLLELVFVIVILGILASLALPRLDRDNRQEAKDNILSAIRYTQHLALIDDKTDPSDAYWQKQFWKINFVTSSSGVALANFYTVSSDRDKDGYVDKNETALDPANGRHFYNSNGNTVVHEDESPNVFIGKLYGITLMTFSGGCANAHHIAFDQLGRPHNGLGSASHTYSTYMSQDCNITASFEDTDITPLRITVQAETGYVSAN